MRKHELSSKTDTDQKTLIIEIPSIQLNDVMLIFNFKIKYLNSM